MSSLFSLRVPLILASQSPRRRRLLEQTSLSFQVQVSPADESISDDESPEATARTLADRKAEPVSKAHPDALVLAADTLVHHQETVLEKPSSPAQARQMLRLLSGTQHTVYTGMALHHRSSDRAVVTGRSTQVRFAQLSDSEIDAYVQTGSPMDKAGGYGIQDHTAPFFVQGLHGDYYNVVGLPLRTLYEALQAEFSDLLSYSTSPPR